MRRHSGHSLRTDNVNGDSRSDTGDSIQSTMEERQLSKEVLSSSPLDPLDLDSSMIPVPLNDEGDRETWGKKVDFLLSVIGFAVDLANVWRFPYLCVKNGGGAFLIPYGIMLIVGGIPLFYMELALGQYNRKGAITCWGRLVPLFKGIGYSVVLIAFYVDFYYNVIIAWSLRYFFASFTSDLPWANCNNTWNSPDRCKTLESRGVNISLSVDGSEGESDGGSNTNLMDEIMDGNETSPASEYFMREILQLQNSSGIEDLGKIKPDIALCLLFVYVICYFSLWKGISTSGKVVWFTALFPYVVLLILLIHGVRLPGAIDGIKYYLEPKFTKITKAEVWVDAATQVFFSLGPGFGVLLAFASYNKFHNNVYKDALLTSCINSATSFVSGFVIFSVLGYMAAKTGKQVKDLNVAKEGPGLAFVVYPEAIATMPGSTFWALIFFMMLLTLGLDSSFGGSEAIITALSDEYPMIGAHREIFVLCLFVLYFLVGLGSCSQGGYYVFILLERYSAGFSILFAVFFEAIAVSWIYGIERFSDDIREMMGFYPGIYWRTCWKYIAPIFILTIIIYGLLTHEPLEIAVSSFTTTGYVYPFWANVLGWCIAVSSIVCIPGMAIFKIATTKGSLKERLVILTTPWRDQVHRVSNLNGIQSESNVIKTNITGEPV